MACLVVLNWPAFMAALQQQQQQQQGQQQQAQRQQGVQPRQHSRQQQTPTSRPQLAEQVDCWALSSCGLHALLLFVGHLTAGGDLCLQHDSTLCGHLHVSNKLWHASMQPPTTLLAAQVSTVRSIGTVVAYAVILTSRCLLFLPRCLLWAVLPILLHAALRRASSEYLPAKQVAGRKGLSDAELAARMAAGPEPAMPGVPFSKVGRRSAGVHRSRVVCVAVCVARDAGWGMRGSGCMQCDQHASKGNMSCVGGWCCSLGCWGIQLDQPYSPTLD